MCYFLVSTRTKTAEPCTHQVFAEEGRTLQGTHRLGCRVDVSKDDMRLAPHFHCLKGYYVQNDAICGKQHVQAALQVLLGELVGQVPNIETGLVSTWELMVR